jgi:hypothetical protein
LNLGSFANYPEFFGFAQHFLSQAEEMPLSKETIVCLYNVINLLFSNNANISYRTL